MSRPTRRRQRIKKQTRKQGVRWGHISELNRRTRPGTAAWASHHKAHRLKMLSTWRYLHSLGGTHLPVKSVGRRYRTPSSDMTLQQMFKAARLLGGKT